MTQKTILLLLLATGCSVPEYALQHTAVDSIQMDGIVMEEDGQQGHAGMWDLVCSFDPSALQINDDLVPDDGTPRVMDYSVAGEVLFASNDALWSTTYDGYESTMPEHISGLQDAGYLSDGIVTLSNGASGCQARWPDGTGLRLSEAACRVGVLEPSADGADAFAAGDDGVLRLRNGEAATIFETNRPIQGLVTANSLGLLVTATAAEIQVADQGGTPQWAAPLQGQLIDLAADDRAIYVHTAIGTGGLIVAYDPNGEILAEQVVPVAGREIAAGGGQLVLALQFEAHSFRLRGQ